MDNSHRPPSSLNSTTTSHSLMPIGGWQTDSNNNVPTLEQARRQSIVESSIRLDMVVMSDGGSRTEIKSAGFLDRLAPTYSVSSWASNRGSALKGAAMRSAARGSLSRIADSHHSATNGGGGTQGQQQQHKQQQQQSREEDSSDAVKQQHESIFKKTQVSSIQLRHNFLSDHDESDDSSDLSFSGMQHMIPGEGSGSTNQHDGGSVVGVDGSSVNFDVNDSSLNQSQRTLPPNHEQHTQSRNDLFAQIQRAIRTVGRQDGVALLQRERQRRILEAELLRDSSRFLLTSKPTTFFTHTPLSATDAEGVMAKRKLWNIGKKKQALVQEVLCELVHDDITSTIDHQTRDSYLSRRSKKYDGSVTAAIGPATEVLQSYWRIYGINVQHQVDFVDKVVRRHSIETYKTIVKEINRFSNRSDAYSNVMRLVALRETLLSALISRANNPLLVRDKHQLEKKRAEEAIEKETKRAKGNILNFKVAGDEWDRERDRQHQRRQQKSLLLEQSQHDDDALNEDYILDQSAIDKAGEDGDSPSSIMGSSALSSMRRSTDTTPNTTTAATLRPRFKAVNLKQKVMDALMPPGYGGAAGGGASSPGGGPNTSSSIPAPNYNISTALGKSKIVTAQIPLESVPGTSQYNNARLSGAAGGVGSLEDRTSVTHATHENMLLEILILISHLRHITVMIVDIITYERMCCREVAVKVSQQIAQVGAGMPQVDEGSKGPEKKAFDVETATLLELRRKRQDDDAKKRKHIAVAGDPLEKLIQSMGDTDDLHLASKVAPSVSAKRINRKPRRKHQAGDVPLPLMWDGRDYLYKIRNDLSPLDETGLGELLGMAGAQYDEKRGVHVESVVEEGGFYCPRFRFENNPFLLANTTFKRSNDERRGRQAAASAASTTTSTTTDSTLDALPQSEAGSGGAGGKKKGSLVVGNPPPPVDSVIVGAYRPHPKTDPIVAANSASISGSTCLYVEDADELVEGRRQKKASETIRAKRRLIAERKKQIERTQMAEIRGLAAESMTTTMSPSASRPGTRHALVILDDDQGGGGDPETRLRDLHSSALSIVDEVNTSSRHIPFKSYFNRNILPDKKERARRLKEAEEQAERDVQRKRLESQGRLANIRDVMGGTSGSGAHAASYTPSHHNDSTRRQLLLAPLSPSSPSQSSQASMLLPSDGSPHMPHLSHTIDSSIRPKEDLSEGLFDAYGRHVNRYHYPSHIYAQEEQPFWERTSLIFARSLDPAFMARRAVLGSLLAHQIGAEAGRVQRAAMRNQGLGGSAVSTSALGGVGAKQQRDPNYKFRIEGMVKDSMMQRCHTSFPPDIATIEDPERAVEQVVVDPVTKTFTVTWGTQPYTEAELLQRHMVIFNHTIHDARTSDTDTKASTEEGPSKAFLSAKRKFLRAMTKVRFAISHVKHQRALPSTQRQLRAAQELERWMEVSGAHDFAQSVHHQLTIPLHKEETQRLVNKAAAERKEAAAAAEQQQQQTPSNNDSTNTTANTTTVGKHVRFLDNERYDNQRPRVDINTENEEGVDEVEDDDSSGEEYSKMPDGYDNPNVLSHPEDTSFRFTPSIANQY